MNPNPPLTQPEELNKEIERIMDYWDFSPTQNEDSRRERVLSEIKNLVESAQKEAREEKDRWVAFFAEDIAQCFIPKCSNCNRRATEQTTKGKHAQEALHRPVNWGYYCKKCADEGREIERDAMYG